MASSNLISKPFDFTTSRVMFHAGHITAPRPQNSPRYVTGAAAAMHGRRCASITMRRVIFDWIGLQATIIMAIFSTPVTFR